MSRFNSMLFHSFVVYTVVIAANCVIAQEEAVPENDGAVEGLIGGILESIGGEGIGSSIQIEAVTDDGNGPVRMFSIGGGPGMGIGSADPMSLVQMAQIQKELELVDEQQEKLKAIRDELNDKMSARMRERLAGDGGKFRFDAEAMAKWTEEMQALKADAEKQIDEVLLPQQRDRLRQLAHHVELKRSGAQDALLDGKLAEELGITAEQRARLRRVLFRSEKETAAEIARLKEKAKAELFAELTPEQQKKLKDLLGDDFDYQQTDWRQRIRQSQRRIQP